MILSLLSVLVIVEPSEVFGTQFGNEHQHSHQESRFSGRSVPGTGYGCENSCNTADVNYVLEAVVNDYPIPGSSRIFKQENDVKFRTRSFIDGGSLSQFCTFSTGGDPTGKTTLLGPCLQAEPGQSVNIKVINNINQNIGPEPPVGEDWIFAERERYSSQVFKDNNFNIYNKNLSSDPSKLVADPENMPHNFDNTNLHVHGLQVVPHLFFPQGTLNATADWITIEPSGPQKCFCYRFDLPDDHPRGSFYYHIHRHGSAAVQGWSGMFGSFLVRGGVENELKEKYNVQKDVPFIIWDPHMAIVGDKKNVDLVKVDTFINGQTDADDAIPYLVNNDYQPTLEFERSEVVHLRYLCGTVEDLCAFEILDAAGRNVPFYNFGSDGVNFERPYLNTKLFNGGAMREELLLQFNETGLYTVVMRNISDKQFFGTGPSDQILAYIKVVPSADSPLTIPIEEFRFSPGQLTTTDITLQEIVRRRTISFSMPTDQTKIPFPQFSVNDHPYNHAYVAETIGVQQAEEWIITNAGQSVHPFHMHVNSFQVKEIKSSFMPDTDFSRYMTNTSYPPNRWRDVVMIPAFGFTRIWVRFEHAMNVGKTVFHCHFLAHEDTGMMANMLITPQKSP